MNSYLTAIVLQNSDMVQKSYQILGHCESKYGWYFNHVIENYFVNNEYIWEMFFFPAFHRYYIDISAMFMQCAAWESETVHYVCPALSFLFLIEQKTK